MRQDKTARHTCARAVLFSTYPEVQVARLKGLPKRLAAAPGVLGFSDGAARVKPGARVRSNPLRKLYATKRWRDPETGVRARIIARDGGVCQMPGCGVLLVGGKNAPNSPVVDHKTPHRGNLLLFWDEDNLQALCKRCHDTEKQRQEHADHATGKGEGWG